METNQGLLQVKIRVKNEIDLILTSDEVKNPLLKSIEGLGKLNLTNINTSNTALEHLDTIKSNNIDLTNSINNLENIKYIRIEGNTSGNSKYSNNTSLEKLDLTQADEVKQEDFQNNEKLRSLPKYDFTNATNLTSVFTNDTNLLPTDLDLSEANNVTRLHLHGSSTKEMEGLKTLRVSTEAPFDENIPQVDVSYTGLDKNALVNLFNTLPYNVGYTVVGNPTINNGVVSGFSANNYIKLDSPFDPGSANWEMMFKITTGSTAVRQQIMGGVGSELGNVEFGLESTQKFIIWMGTSQSSHDIVYGKTGTHNVAYNTVYYVKLIFNGSKYVLSYSLDGTNFTDDIVIESTLTINGDYRTIGIDGFNNTYPFLGSIDLNESYIKINSITSTGPINYTTVGSPTIVDGIASGFSASNYLEVLNLDLNKHFETRISFSGLEASTPSKCLFRLYYSNTNWLAYYIAYASNSIAFYDGKNYASVGYLNNSEPFDLLVSIDDKNVYSKVIQNNAVVLSAETSLSDLPAFSKERTAFRYWLGGSFLSDLPGSIDLNKTYIKINNKLWFGHTSDKVTWFNGKPAQTKSISVIGANGTSSLSNTDKQIVTKKKWDLYTTNTFPYMLPIQF